MSTAGSKREREALRLQLLTQGADLATIAENMRVEFGFRPREAWRYAHGWTQHDAAEQYNSHEPSGTSPMRGARIGSYEKWPSYGRRPSFDTLMILARAYGCAVMDLLDDHDRAKFPTAEWQLLSSRTTLESNFFSPATISKVLMDAARESAQFAHRAGQTNVGPTDLDQLDADMDKIARLYLTCPLPVLVPEILQLRDSIARLIDGRQYPTQTRHLYRLAAQTYGLLAAGCTDLGHHHDAETHARTAALCADLAENPLLQAWVRSLRSGIALWDDRSDDAVTHAQAGLSIIGDGIEKVRLHSLHARAQARLGNVDAVTDAIRAAHEARDNATDEATYIGMFAFPRANELRCAGTALLWAGKPQDAARSFGEALNLYLNDDPDGSYAHIAVTRVDLALAYLSEGQIDSAHDALGPVFALSAQHRLDGIVRRVPVLQQALTTPTLANQNGASALLDALSTFAQRTAAEEYETLGTGNPSAGMITP